MSLVVKTNDHSDEEHSNKNDSLKHWSYERQDYWGKLYSEANGKHQSPINLSTQSAHVLEKLLHRPIKINYSPYVNYFKEIKNNGHSFVVSGENFPLSSDVKAKFIKNKFRFLQFHMHWGPHDQVGSEHTIDGKPYSAELHFVHWNYKDYATPGEAMASNNHDGLLVLGVFVKTSIKKHNEFNKIISKLNEIRLSGQSAELESLDVDAFFPKTMDKYWTYLGSLTTPPCYESVQWVVFNDPIELTPFQLNEFRKLYTCTGEMECSLKTKMLTNFRHCCPINDRRLIKSFQS